jgi:hypothetical protein
MDSNEVNVVIVSVIAVYVVELSRRAFWGFLNYLSDNILRREGWDEAEEFTPMVDYVPFYRLFQGVDDLVPSKRIRRKKI